MCGTKKHSIIPRPYNEDCETCHVCCPAQCWRDVQTQPPPLLVRMVLQKLGSLHPWLHAQRPVAVSVLQQRSGKKNVGQLGQNLRPWTIMDPSWKNAKGSAPPISDLTSSPSSCRKDLADFLKETFKVQYTQIIYGCR